MRGTTRSCFTQTTQPDYGKSGDQVRDFFLLAANNDPEASEFLTLWHAYCHEVDDVIDNDQWDPETLLKVFILANTVYSHPFYVRHASLLQMPALMATALYEASVHWEKDPALWKRRWADVLRHAGNEVTLAVAMICGGWPNVRKLTAPLLAICYIHHADKYGVPQ